MKGHHHQIVASRCVSSSGVNNNSNNGNGVDVDDNALFVLSNKKKKKRRKKIIYPYYILCLIFLTILSGIFMTKTTNKLGGMTKTSPFSSSKIPTFLGSSYSSPSSNNADDVGGMVVNDEFHILDDDDDDGIMNDDDDDDDNNSNNNINTTTSSSKKKSLKDHGEDMELRFLPTTTNRSNDDDTYYSKLEDDNKDSSSSSVVRIVHVWSPYVVYIKNNNDDDNNQNTTTHSKQKNQFAPLDQAQNLTWESMWRAQQYANRKDKKYYYDNVISTNNTTTKTNSYFRVEVQIYCAILWFDVSIIQNLEPPLCKPNNTIVLKRSTNTIYPWLKPPIHYPFVQDMIDPLIGGRDVDGGNGNGNGATTTDGKNEVLLSSSSYDYLILTNSDISVVKAFYVLAAKAISKYDYDAFTVNRRTISKGYQWKRKKKKKKETQDNTTGVSDFDTTTLLYSSSSDDDDDDDDDEDTDDDSSDDDDVIVHPWTYHNFSYIESSVITNYKIHPGSDCFIMKSELVPKFTLGNLFVGHPPWARVLRHILGDHMAMHFRAFESKFGWTYHLGNDQDWKKPRTTISSDSSSSNNNNTDGETPNVNNSSISITSQTQQQRQKQHFTDIPGFPLPLQIRIMKGCIFNNPNNPNPNGHYFQNTQNCAYLCTGYHSSLQMISSKMKYVDGQRIVRPQYNNNNKIEVPPFAFDPHVFVDVTWERQQRIREKRIAKMMMSNNNNNNNDGNTTTTMTTATTIATTATAIMKIRNNSNTTTALGGGGRGGIKNNVIVNNNNLTLAEKIARNKEARKKNRKNTPNINNNQKIDDVRSRLKEHFGGGGGVSGSDVATKQFQQRKQELYEN